MHDPEKWVSGFPNKIMLKKRIKNAPESAFTLADVPGVAVVVEKAVGTKCARSWKILPTVGEDAEYPDVSPRDAQALRHGRGAPFESSNTASLTKPAGRRPRGDMGRGDRPWMFHSTVPIIQPQPPNNLATPGVGNASTARSGLVFRSLQPDPPA